jgi:DNA-binding protein HU-beta
MTKLDIINESAKLTGLTKVETELVFDSIINSIKISLSKGKRVDIRGFGSFITKVKDEREARNPATNETFILEKRYIPAFKVSKLLKEFVDLEMKEI